MGRFEVRVGEVDALSFRVSMAASDVRAVQGEVAAGVCYDTGDAALSGALSAFQQVWADFTEQAAQAVDATASAIAAAAASYAQVDSTVMADPRLTAGFVRAVTDGGDGVAQMLVAPLLPGSGGSVPAGPSPSAAGGSGIDQIFNPLLGSGGSRGGGSGGSGTGGGR